MALKPGKSSIVTVSRPRSSAGFPCKRVSRLPSAAWHIFQSRPSARCSKPRPRYDTWSRFPSTSRIPDTWACGLSPACDVDLRCCGNRCCRGTGERSAQERPGRSSRGSCCSCVSEGNSVATAAAVIASDCCLSHRRPISSCHRSNDCCSCSGRDSARRPAGRRPAPAPLLSCCVHVLASCRPSQQRGLPRERSFVGSDAASQCGRGAQRDGGRRDDAAPALIPSSAEARLPVVGAPVAQSMADGQL